LIYPTGWLKIEKGTGLDYSSSHYAKGHSMPPSKRKMAVFVQICKQIPRNLVPKLARKHGVDKQSREFDPWSHVASLIYAQLSHTR